LGTTSRLWDHEIEIHYYLFYYSAEVLSGELTSRVGLPEEKRLTIQSITRSISRIIEVVRELKTLSCVTRRKEAFLRILFLAQPIAIWKGTTTWDCHSISHAYFRVNMLNNRREMTVWLIVSHKMVLTNMCSILNEFCESHKLETR